MNPEIEVLLQLTLFLYRSSSYTWTTSLIDISLLVQYLSQYVTNGACSLLRKPHVYLMVDRHI